MSFVTTYQFHGKLLVRLKRNRRYPFFDSYLDKVFSRYAVTTEAPADLEITLDGRRDRFEDCYWVDGKYAVRKNFIGYENRFKSARWSVAIDGLLSDRTSVHIGANILARPVLAGETLYSLIRYKLLQKGYALLHASGIGFRGKGFFFAARGGVGKTITAIRAVGQGATLYGDDTVIVGPAGELFGFAVPFNLRFTYDIQGLLGIRFPLSLRFEIALKKLLGILTLGRYRLFTILPPEKIFPQALGSKTVLGGAFILMSGETFKLEEIKDKNVFSEQLVKIIQFESSELIPALQAYAHIDPQPFLSAFWQQMRSVLENSILPLPCYRLTMPKIYKKENFHQIWSQIQQCNPSATASTI